MSANILTRCNAVLVVLRLIVSSGQTRSTALTSGDGTEPEEYKATRTDNAMKSASESIRPRGCLSVEVIRAVGERQGHQCVPPMHPVVPHKLEQLRADRLCTDLIPAFYCQVPPSRTMEADRGGPAGAGTSFPACLILAADVFRHRPLLAPRCLTHLPCLLHGPLHSTPFSRLGRPKMSRSIPDGASFAHLSEPMRDSPIAGFLDGQSLDASRKTCLPMRPAPLVSYADASVALLAVLSSAIDPSW